MPENTAIEIKDGTLVIANSAFSGYRNLISVTIPNSVTIIGKRAFKDCSGLTSLPIGNGVTSIGEEAFYCCYGISSVTIPNSVTTIGENAFYCCHMTTVIIPTSVTSIGDDAFCMCRNLTSVVSYIKEPFATNSFYIYYDATLYVPKGTYDKYKNTYSWNKYKTIKEIGDANSDGNVDEMDMIAIANHIMGETLEDFDEKAADMNGDQKIDVADIVELINQLAPKD